MPTPIVDFFYDREPDDSGRFRVDILGRSDEWLEDTHDYIQWLFPLDIVSLAYEGAPVLTRGDITAFQRSKALQENFKAGLVRMCQFYDDTDHWLTLSDHNHKRISRILKSTRMLLDIEDAKDFYDFVMAIHKKAGEPVSEHNREFWKQAIT